MILVKHTDLYTRTVYYYKSEVWHELFTQTDGL